MHRRHLLSLIAAPLALVAAAARAQAANTAEAVGEVTRVDRAAARVGLRHGEIAALDLPPMTMHYRVRDPAMLDGLNAGDRVRFTVERAGSGWVVTRLLRL
jgi:Cu/Ag efflux protein CusF